MRSLSYIGDGKVAWTELPAPAPGPNDVVARPLAVARCDIDAFMVTDNLFPGPYPVGHEFAGEITEVGSDITRWKPGDRVIAPFQISCGSCETCDQRRFAACIRNRAPAGAAFGFGPAGGDHGGAMSELILIPNADHLLVSSPNLDPVSLAGLGDNISDGYRCVASPLAASPGADVLIVGGSGDSVPYYAVLWAKVLGARSARYIDNDDRRCGVASDLGADATLVEGEWPRRFHGAPITVAFTTDQEALRATIRSTDPYGYCTIAGIHFSGSDPLPLLEMYTTGITIHTSRTEALGQLPEILEYVVNGSFDPLEVPSTIVTPDEAEAEWTRGDTKLIVSWP